MKFAEAGTSIDAAAVKDDDEVDWIAILSPLEKSSSIDCSNVKADSAGG
jgi:hypothetical protein